MKIALQIPCDSLAWIPYNDVVMYMYMYTRFGEVSCLMCRLSLVLAVFPLSVTAGAQICTFCWCPTPGSEAQQFTPEF